MEERNVNISTANTSPKSLRTLKWIAFACSCASLFLDSTMFRTNQAALADVDSVTPFLNSMVFRGSNWTEFVIPVVCYLGLALLLAAIVITIVKRSPGNVLPIIAILIGTGGAGDAFGLIDYRYLGGPDLTVVGIISALLGLFGIVASFYLCIKAGSKRR